MVSNKQLVRLGQQFIEYRVSRFYKFSCHHSTSFNVPSHISLWTHGAKNCKVEIQTRTQQRPGNPCREAVTALSPIIMPLTLSIACPEPECSGMVELACQVQLAPAVLHPRIRNAQIQPWDLSKRNKQTHARVERVVFIVCNFAHDCHILS